MTNEIISARSVRNLIKEYCGNVPISKEAVVMIQKYLDDEAHRIAEAGTKDFMEENNLRKCQKIRPLHRLSQHHIKKVIDYDNS